MQTPPPPLGGINLRYSLLLLWLIGNFPPCFLLALTEATELFGFLPCFLRLCQCNVTLSKNVVLDWRIILIKTFTLMSHHSQRQWLSPLWWGPQLGWNNIMSLWAALLLVVNHIWQAGPMFLMFFLQTDQSGDSVCRHMWQSQMLPSLSLYYLMAFLCSAGSSLNMKRQRRNENVSTDYTQVNDSQNMQNISWHVTLKTKWQKQIINIWSLVFDEDFI